MTIAELQELHQKVVHERLDHKGRCTVSDKKDKNCLVCREETWIKKYHSVLNSVCSDCFLRYDELLGVGVPK